MKFGGAKECGPSPINFGGVPTDVTIRDKTKTLDDININQYNNANANDNANANANDNAQASMKTATKRVKAVRKWRQRQNVHALTKFRNNYKLCSNIISLDSTSLNINKSKQKHS